MQGKRHTTEPKIRILREADGGKSILHQPEPKTNTPPGPVFGTRSGSPTKHGGRLIAADRIRMVNPAGAGQDKVRANRAR